MSSSGVDREVEQPPWPVKYKTFKPSELEQRLRRTEDGRLRKQKINLEDCQLREMINYKCWLDGDQNDSRSKAICEPVLRLFRQCASGLSVETTATEVTAD